MRVAGRPGPVHFERGASVKPPATRTPRGQQCRTLRAGGEMGKKQPQEERAMWLYTMPDKDGSRRLVDLETDTVIRVIQADRPGAPASIRHFRGHAAGPAP